MRRFDLQHFSHISTIATALVAVLALVIAVWQIKAAENIQREASAREAFKEYLKLAIDKPDFANAQPGDNKGAKSGYEWFVTYFLYSAEQIYTAYPDDPQWPKGWQQKSVTTKFICQARNTKNRSSSSMTPTLPSLWMLH